MLDNKAVREVLLLKGAELLRDFGLSEKAVNELLEGKINVSKSFMLYLADDEAMGKVKEIENDSTVVVHIIKGLYEIGGESVVMTNYLVITKENIDAESPLPLYEAISPRFGYRVFAYIVNESNGHERFGSIGVIPRYSGLMRTC